MARCHPCSAALMKLHCGATQRASCTAGRRCGVRAATPRRSWHGSGARTGEAAEACRLASSLRCKCCTHRPCAPATSARCRCWTPIEDQHQHEHTPALLPRNAGSRRCNPRRHRRIPSEAALALSPAARAGFAAPRCRPRAGGAARACRAGRRACRESCGARDGALRAVLRERRGAWSWSARSRACRPARTLCWCSKRSRWPVLAWLFRYKYCPAAARCAAAACAPCNSAPGSGSAAAVTRGLV